MRPAMLALVAGMLLIGAGCQTSRAPSGAALEYWTLSLKPTYTDFMEGLRVAYERENPGVQAEWLDLPERILFLKLLASVAAGMPPDLVNIGTPDAARLADNGALTPTGRLVSDAEKQRYFPQLWGAVTIDGQNFCIPWYVSVRVMMYNKDLFRRAGLDPGHPPQTWDEIELAARAMRKTGSYGFMPTIRIMEDWQMDGLPLLAPATSTADGPSHRAGFATPAHAAWLDWYARLYREDVIPPETLTGGYPDAVRRFKEGRLAMLVTGPQFLLSIRQDAPDIYAVTGVAPLPRGKAGIVPASVMHFVIPRGAHDPAGAARLALFLTSPANQLALCKLVPLLPSTVETARDPFFTKGNGKYPLDDEAIRIDAAQLPYARDLTPALPKQDLLNRIIQDAVEQAVYGRATGLEALQQAAARYNAL